LPAGKSPAISTTRGKIRNKGAWRASIADCELRIADCGLRIELKSTLFVSPGAFVWRAVIRGLGPSKSAIAFARRQAQYLGFATPERFGTLCGQDWSRFFSLPPQTPPNPPSCTDYRSQNLMHTPPITILLTTLLMQSPIFLVCLAGAILGVIHRDRLGSAAGCAVIGFGALLLITFFFPIIQFFVPSLIYGSDMRSAQLLISIIRLVHSVLDAAALATVAAAVFSNRPASSEPPR
jgi:hypothetical protein